MFLTDVTRWWEMFCSVSACTCPPFRRVQYWLTLLVATDEVLHCGKCVVCVGACQTSSSQHVAWHWTSFSQFVGPVVFSVTWTSLPEILCFYTSCCVSRPVGTCFKLCVWVCVRESVCEKLKRARMSVFYWLIMNNNSQSIPSHFIETFDMDVIILVHFMKTIKNMSWSYFTLKSKQYK